MPRCLTLLAAVALLLAACSSDKPRALSPDRPSAPAATPAPAQASVTVRPPAGPTAPATGLSRALLSPSDLPPGFRTMDESSVQGDVDTTRYCDMTRTYRVMERARAQFGQGPADPVFYHVVATFAPGEAQRGLDETRELFRTCTSWKETAQDGSVTSYRATLLPFPDLGDQTLAFRMDIDSARGTNHVTVVQVRHGETTSSLLYAATGNAATDMALIERLARRGDERLVATMNGR